MVVPCLLNKPAKSALDCPGSPVLAGHRVERVRDQRLLAHVPVIAIAQSTRGARACVRRCTEPQRRGHPRLSILCQFCLVHGRPQRASARSSRTSRRAFSQPAPPPQRTESSIVTLQTPCPGPGSSTEHFQTPVQELGGRSVLFNPFDSDIALNRSAFAARAVVSSGCAPRSGLFSADARHDSLVQVNSRPVPCLRREAHLSNPNAQTLHAPRPTRRQHFRGALRASVQASFQASVAAGPPLPVGPA